MVYFKTTGKKAITTPKKKNIRNKCEELQIFEKVGKNQLEDYI